MQRIQHLDLEHADMCSRLEFAAGLMLTPNMIRNICFKDEAHFTRDGIHNTRNSH
jgi:hypothetical protein